MEERRTGWLLVVLLVGQLVFLAIQGARGSSSDTFLEAWGLRLLGPAARTVTTIPESVSGAREGLRLRGSLQEENRRLRREVEELRLQLLQLTDVEQEMRRLGDAVRYSAPPGGRIRAVDIVYADHVSWLRTLLLYTGDEPAREGQPVLAPQGLVGRVVTVAGPYAKVQIITDRAAGVGAMVLRTRRQGVVRGSGQGEGLRLDYVPLQADVRPGDQVLTAGIDGIYPRGIPIGTVVEVTQEGQLFHGIEVAPAVDLGSLDQVYLLDYTPPPPRVREALPGARP
ncbi:MAG TPA: rod shape-determining protein MreC [Thermoanaerobaculia bacterium]|nr:rod shape-determining protein MreC [Thermoanaerobaculia bacterium]